MKNINNFLLICFSIFLVACNPAQKLLNEADINNSIQLKLPSTEGANGTGVAYNSAKNIYYTAFAGNSSFPLEVFDQTGQFISKTTMQEDFRGFWYNENKNALEGNTFDNSGIYDLLLKDSGLPNGQKKFVVKLFNQPSEQSCGAYKPETNEILFYSNGRIYGYNLEDGQATFERKLLYANGFTSFNTTSFIYTGVKKLEIALLNYKESELIFFNLKNGKYTAKVVLPENYPMSDSFCMSYTNNLLWLYDDNRRVWKSLKIWK